MNEDVINGLVKHVIESRAYGEMIPHHEIQGILKVNAKNRKYYGMVGRANRMLTEKGKRLQNRSKVGYIVLEPDNYVDEAESQYSRGVKRAKEAMRVLTYAPVSLMSDEAREHYHMVEKGVKSVVATVLGGLQEIRFLNRRKIKINNY